MSHAPLWFSLCRFLSDTRQVVFALVAFALAVGGIGGFPSTASAEPPPTLAEVEAKVASLAEQMTITNEEYNTIAVQLEESRQRQQALDQELAASEGEVKEEEQRLSEIGVEAYQSGGPFGPLHALAGGGSPQVFLDQVSYLELFKEKQRAAIDEYAHARKTVQEAKEKADAEVELQAKQEKELSERKEQLQKDLAHWEDLRAQLAPSPVAGGNYTYNGNASGIAEIAVKFAYAQIGLPYSFGAAGPNAYDCSGLTMAAWREAGVSLPHSSSLQYSYTATKVDRSALAPGDLVVFYSDLHHVAIYVGNGQVIHASQPGQPVTVAAMSSMPFAGAVRPG